MADPVMTCPSCGKTASLCVSRKFAKGLPYRGSTYECRCGWRSKMFKDPTVPVLVVRP